MIQILNQCGLSHAILLFYINSKIIDHKIISNVYFARLMKQKTMSDVLADHMKLYCKDNEEDSTCN